jgi:hypothetical protein
MSKRLFWLPIAIFTGCFNPDYSGDGGFRCRQDAASCPNGYVCNAQQQCVSTSGETTTDAGMADLPPVTPDIKGPGTDLPQPDGPTQPQACVLLAKPELVDTDVDPQATFGFDADESSNNDELVLAYIGKSNRVNLAARTGPGSTWAVYPITNPGGGTDGSQMGAGAVGVSQFNGNWVVVYYTQSNEIYAANSTGRNLLANNTAPTTGLDMALRANQDNVALAVWPAGSNIQIVGIDRFTRSPDEVLDIAVGTGTASAHIAVDTDRAAKETHIGYLDTNNKLFYTRWTVGEDKWLYSDQSIASAVDITAGRTGIDVLAQQERYFVYPGADTGGGPAVKISTSGTSDEESIIAGGSAINPGGPPRIAGIGTIQGVTVINHEDGNVWLTARKTPATSWAEPVKISKASLNVDVIHQVNIVATKGGQSGEAIFHLAIIGEVNNSKTTSLYNQPVNCSFNN